jgi:hypothetical protein
MTCPGRIRILNPDTEPMKSPDYYRAQARHCRRDALGLAIFALACLVALPLIGRPPDAWWWVPLALMCGLLTSAGGAANECALARRMERLADQEETFQPAERI